MLVTYYEAREQLEVEQYLAVNASHTPGFLNAIYYPQYWLGLEEALWPLYRWTDGYTPGPDQFANKTYYAHWGSIRWGGRRESAGLLS